MECYTFIYEKKTYRFGEFQRTTRSQKKVLVGEQSLWEALTDNNGEPKDKFAEKMIDLFYAFVEDVMFNKNFDAVQQAVFKLR